MNDMQMISPLLVGRDRELDLLSDLIDRVAVGTGTTVVVTGDAGVGKTSLCRAVKQRAIARGVRVMEGRCSPSELGLPYAPFVDLIRFRLARGEADEATRVLGPISRRLGRFLTELPEGEGVVKQTLQAVRIPFGPIFDAFRRLASHGPVLLLLEDLQWADHTSRDLLSYLAERISSLPVLIVATLRSDELPREHPAHRLVASLVRSRAGLRVHLEPLDRGEVREMLAAMTGREPGDALLRAVYERTEGNPLFVEELMSSLARRPEDGDESEAAALAALPPPATIREVVLGRIEPLGSDAMEVLSAAAVAGPWVPYELLLRVLGWEEERLLQAVEILVRHWVLEEETAPRSTPGEDVLRFRHGLVREVIYDRLLGRRRRALHLDVGRALEELHGDDPVRHVALGRHFRLGGDPAGARRHALRAGDEAVRLCAWEDARQLYRQALPAADADPGDRAAVLERLGEVAWWQSRVGEAVGLYRRALELRRSAADALGEVRVLRRLAYLQAYQEGDVDGGVEALEGAMALLETADASASTLADEEILLLNDLARLHLVRCDLPRARSLLERARTLATGRGDTAELAIARVLSAGASALSGNVAEALEQMAVAADLLDPRDLSLERAAAAYRDGIRLLDAVWEHETARAWAEEAMEHARRHDVPAERALFEAYLASADRRAGRLEEAAEKAGRAVDELRTAERTELREALRILGDVERVRGRFPAARGAYEEALRLGERRAAVGLALVTAATGDRLAGAERLEELIVAFGDENRLFQLRVLPHLVELLAHSGAVERAESVLVRLRRVSAESDFRPVRASLLQASAVMAWAGGGEDEALELLRRAAAAWREVGLPVRAVRAERLRADILLGGGRAEDHAAYAHGIAKELMRMGAGAELEHLCAAMRSAKMPLPVRRTKVRNPVLGALTPRELEVLDEVARGATNKQVARALGIRPKTVANHVSSILGKLGCATRTEAARLAIEGGGA